MAIEYLPDRRIERAAIDLLIAYGRKFAEVTEPPVPAEEILDCYFDLSLGFDDLRARFDDADVLGATWIEDATVLIDTGLDPVENPEKEGRYRFTLAHEAGHWALHRQILLDARSAPLLGGKPEPSVICRNTTRKPRIEIQADRFAGFLLMPEDMVIRWWEKLTGSGTPQVAEDEVREQIEQADPGQEPIAEVSSRMGEAFHVSGQAMQIRLRELELLLMKRPPPSLFG